MGIDNIFTEIEVIPWIDFEVSCEIDDKLGKSRASSTHGSGWAYPPRTLLKVLSPEGDNQSSVSMKKPDISLVTRCSRRQHGALLGSGCPPSIAWPRKQQGLSY